MNVKWFWRSGLLTVAGILSGCASIGHDEYSCPGSEQGVVCVDSYTIMEATKNPKEKQRLLNESKRKYHGHEDHKTKEVLVDANPVRLGNNIKPISQPVPILKEAEVLRVWVAPWKDALQDLHWPGYLFTEITPRRWTFGEDEVKDTRVTTSVPIKE